jgi:flavin-dependent dehydrogenase
MKEDNFTDVFGRPGREAGTPAPNAMELGEGSRVAVLGSGPAGSFFAYFLIDMARRIGYAPQVDIYEKRIFSMPGPIGCNMCGGIISESLVQSLAAEGIILPPTIVERGIDSYILHMDVGSTRIDTPLHEKRIAAVHRGAGPKGVKEIKWGSFDGYLLDLAKGKGANLVRGQVENVSIVDGRPALNVKGGELKTYDFLAVCVGVNSPTLKLFGDLPIAYTPPKTTKTYISEFFLGEELVAKHLGSSMHVFLLNLPRVEFSALIPKGDYVTFCMLGEDIDDNLVKSLIDTPQVRQCFPPGWEPPPQHCHCSPKINVKSADPPFADRMVFIGDCGATRLYKDGIGAAYRTAKAAATTAAFHGVSAADFRKHFLPVCSAIEKDNAVGRLIFIFTRLIQRLQQGRRGVLGMVLEEQASDRMAKRMSTVMWDTFTGSAPYGEIILRTMHPSFIWNFAKHIAAGMLPGKGSADRPVSMEALLKKPDARKAASV